MNNASIFEASSVVFGANYSGTAVPVVKCWNAFVLVK